MAKEIAGLYPRTTPAQLSEIVRELGAVDAGLYSRVLSEVKKNKSVTTIGYAEITEAIRACNDVRPISHEIIVDQWKTEALPREEVAEFFGKLGKVFRNAGGSL